MSRLITSVKNYLLAWGLPGLFFIAFLDSAGIPLVGGPDAVVMFLAWQRPELLPWIVLSASLGSTLGCWVLFRLGKKGGDLALRRFDDATKERIKERVRRNDIMTVLVAVIAPPPSPTKLMLLAAGVVGMTAPRFLAGVFVGRSLRYLLDAYLGARFGDEAAAILKAHYPTIGLGLLALILIWVGVQYLRHRRSSLVT